MTANKDIRILVVEDSPTQAMQLRLLLEEQAYHVSLAANGEKGLYAARKTNPTIIITDIVMPVMDGYAMCNAIKQDEILRHIPIILLTSLSDPADFTKGLRADADYYNTKPYDEAYLLSRLRDILVSPVAQTAKAEQAELEIVFGGKRHMVHSDRRQILNLLLSTYENAVQRNLELVKTQEALEQVNEKLEEKLHELGVSEERFRSLVMTIPDIVYRIDPDGNFTFINTAIKRLGYVPEELIGRHFSEIILPTDAKMINRSLVFTKYKGKKTGDKSSPKLFDERRSGDRKTTGLEVRLVPKHGSGPEPAFVQPLSVDMITVDINSSGMYEISSDRKEKMFMGTVGVIRDISARKHMERALKESEQRLKTILEYTEAGILVIEPEKKKIVEANPAAARMVGLPIGKIRGSICDQFGCWDDKKLCPTTAKKEDVFSAEQTLRQPDGDSITVLKTVAPIIFNNRKHLLESFVDISKLKQVEDELHQAHDELEIKVEERTLELKHSQAQLIQAEKVAALATLTAGIAHELNNPMMGMLNFIQYCLKKTTEKNKIFEVLTDAEHETKRCIAIVNNLLTFSRIEKQGEEKYQKVELASLFDRILRLLAYRIEKENISINKKIDENTPEIWIKPNNIQQVFLNITGNALDALKDSQKKEIRIDARPRGEFVCVTVSDTGPGIDPEIHSKIFDPFFTTKPTGKGTGLGLSVSRSIVEAHSGKIRCESEIGKGATFTVLLPIERGPEV